MASKISLTEDDCQNVTWRVVEITDTYRRSVGHGTHPATGLPIEVQRTEFLAEDDLVALNAEERNSTDGKRWSSGMGSDKGGNVPLVRTARIPLNKFYADVAPRLQQGDEDFMRWWLERDENQPFRTRNGNL